MSTAARKARKRERHAALNSGWRSLTGIENGIAVFVAKPGTDLPTGRVLAPAPFQHPVKVGTPVQDRFENQPAPQVVNRLGRVSVKRTSKAIARLRSRGVEVDS